MFFSIRKPFINILKAVITFFTLTSTIYAEDLSEYDLCILQAIKKTDGNTPTKDIKKSCSEPASHTTSQSTNENSLIQTRLDIDKKNKFQPFTLMAHKPNYILPIAYNHTGYNADLYRQQYNNSNIALDDFEAQFQISIKTPLAINLFNKDIDLYTGYTNRSFWQVYNSKLSSPFRESNHEPEIWLQTSNRTGFYGFDNRISMLGISHQSNGQGGALSRSWNRAYINLGFEKSSFVFAVKLWKRFSENSATDDNPDITDYMGHGEFRAIFKKENHTFSLMSRNNIESSFDKGTTELGWSFPIGKRKDLKGYIQIFSGYGESLIDYDQTVNRIGVGIILSDWL